MEPYTELPAMALATVGFVIFIALVAQAYSTYQQKAFLSEHYQDAANLAEKLGKDSMITSSVHPDIIDASRIELISRDPKELMEKYGAYYNFMFKIEVSSENRHYSVIVKNPQISEPGTGISASIPVTVGLNDVQALPGILTVNIWRK
jgi:hypothetical protein